MRVQQGLSAPEYQAKKEAAAVNLIGRLEAIFPGLSAGLDYEEVGTPRTHRRFLGREDGTYAPVFLGYIASATVLFLGRG